MKKKQKKSVEFSKKIVIGVSIVTVSVTIFSCVMVAITKDTTPLAYLIPAVFVEASAATGFYYDKSKAENKIKLMKENKIKPSTTDFDSM